MVRTYTTIPNAQTSDFFVCLPDSSVRLGDRSSMAIHRAEPFTPVVEFVVDEDVIMRDMPKSASSGMAESDIRMLSWEYGVVISDNWDVMGGSIDILRFLNLNARHLDCEDSRGRQQSLWPG